MNTARCHRFSEDIVGLLEGTASDNLRSHIASCDACRDTSHSLELISANVAKAGNDFAVTPSLAERLAAIANEPVTNIPIASTAPVAAPADSMGDRISETRLKTEPPPPPALLAVAAKGPKKSRKSLWLLLAACASVTASAVVGVKIADHQRSPSAAATRAWHGKVAKLARSGADASAESGLTVVTPSGKLPLGEGAEIKAGMHIATDGKTRARLWLDDGSTIVLDRATDVTVESTPRTMTLNDGAVLADVAHVDNAPWAKLKTPNGDVKVLGTKFALTAAADRTNVEVLRGEVEVATAGDSHKVAAGQEGVVGKDGKVDVAPANDLAQRSAFGEQLISTHNEDTEAPANGLGELRAKRPGRQDEKDHAVHLAKHAVKVRIAGNVARTEIDETFANDTDDELEGIYRFPLPPGAQIERLALEVDGKLLDGEFVDKAKAAAIWRGAIQAAAPKAPKPKEEIIWVPGPWHDPALLEWQRGGRFELRIFPIPKRGSRRVVIAYTETVAPVSGVRRYIYPLPQGSSSKISIDQFTLDAQVLGHDSKVPVRARGYELEKKTENGAERLSSTMTAFVPSGDLAIEYGLDDKATDASTWAYRAAEAAPPPVDEKNAKKGAAKEVDPIGNDPFVAIALRPKLPKWSESKPRDQVIVVDAGRAMYGERFARAKRLAVQMTQEMDRRDRVTVIACDVSCKSMPGGFVAPGAPSAHDVDAFLGGVTPDGASDLVNAVRAASKASGHDSARDLRVAVLSDGVATAGYRSNGRVSTEVNDSLHASGSVADARSMVVTVPIGADADVNLLGDIARGGGGVVVPYQPGQRLEATAIEVLNATYGTTLRDVEVVLPDGLRDSAPAAIAPLRAGSETIVTARMTRDDVKGDVIIRGKVGGDPFEAKYPIDVHASTDAGNAFVPRLFAAARISDRERQPGNAAAANAELVALSRRFSVPSRTTSLLVLESEAMFKAFGIERAEHGPSWTGEELARGSVVATIAGGKGAGAADPSSPLSLNPFGDDDAKEAKKGLDSASLGDGFGGFGHGAGGGGNAAGPSDIQAQGRSAGAPAATMAPPPPPSPAKPKTATTKSDEESGPNRDRSAPMAEKAQSEAMRRAPPSVPRNIRPRPGGQFMKKVFVRHGNITTDSSPSVSADKVAQARAAVAAAPDERSKHKDLAKMLALSGQLDELNETLEKWSTRDPLDADVIVGRADVAARKGDRDGSLRILGGALASNAMSAADAFIVAQQVGRSYDRLGKPEACSFYVAAAELQSTNTDAVAKAVSCERTQGRAAAADRWLVGLKDTQRKAIEASLIKIEKDKSSEGATFGDVVVNATWQGGADLDIAIVDPSGRRASAVTRMKGTRVEGATARDHESVALSSGEGGSFLIEVVRSSIGEGGGGGGSTSPVSGTVTVKAFGQSQAIPFTLTGARTQVGRVDARWEQELVAVDDDGFGGFGQNININPPQQAPFDRGAAAAALQSVNVNHCNASGQVGTGHVMVTFSTTGRVSEVVVDDANFSGTPAGRCVQTAFFNAIVPSFTGGSVKVGKSFNIGSR